MTTALAIPADTTDAEYLDCYVVCAGCGNVGGDHQTCDWCGARNCDVEARHYDCGRSGDGFALCDDCAPTDRGCPVDDPPDC